MTRGVPENDDHPNAQVPSRMLWAAFGAMWLLGLLTFSLPGREGPESLGTLDWIALTKTAARLCVIFVGIAGILHYRNYPRRRLVLHALLPLLVYLGWAILSTAWSPLKTVSLGQAGGLTAQLLLAALIGLDVTTPSDEQWVLFQLNSLLLAMSAILLAVHLVRPESSGLLRDLSDEGALGLVHPTSAGATASLGIVLLVLTALVWNPFWLRWLLVPGLLTHSAILLFATSRMAIGMTATVLLIAFPVLVQRTRLAAVAVAVSCLGCLYLCLDPGLATVDAGLGTTSKYLMRDESTEQISSFTGRTELWSAVWVEFSESPLQGCGYFVTSRNGLLDVWSGPANRTAHNVLLQVLVSTGVIGFMLFLWGGGRVVRLATPGLTSSRSGRRLGTFLILIGIWYAGWGQLCESFMGPIQPESITFFGCLGLALSSLRVSDIEMPTPSGPSDSSFAGDPGL